MIGRARMVLAWLRVGRTFTIELSKSTWATIRAVLGPADKLRPAILAVPLDVRSPAGAVLFADMVTLTPGTTSLDIAADGKTLAGRIWLNSAQADQAAVLTRLPR